MTTEQTQIADKLLKHLDNNGGNLTVDQIMYFLKEYKLDSLSKEYMLDTIIEDGFMDWWGNDRYRLKISRNGQAAAKTGIDEFLRLQAIKKQPLTIKGGNINLGGTIGEQNISHSSFSFDDSSATLQNRQIINPDPTPYEHTHAQTNSTKSKFFSAIKWTISWTLQHAIMPTVCSVLSVIIWETIIRPFLILYGYLR